MTDQSIEVKWLGHAAVQLDYEDTTVVIDPFFTGNPKFPGDEHKPENIDLLLITHGHNDHFGDAIELAKEHEPTIPVIHELSVFLEKNGVENAVGMNFGGTYTHEDSGIKVTMVQSTHSAGYQNEDGNIQYVGTPGGYVVEFPDGNTFYHCGDTSANKDMAITNDLFDPNIGLLAIGGHFTMDPKGAAYAASELLDLDTVIPIHWGTFEVLAGTPQDLEDELEGTGISVNALSPGETIEL